jgi:hypothetical protein
MYRTNDNDEENIIILVAGETIYMPHFIPHAGIYKMTQTMATE